MTNLTISASLRFWLSVGLVIATVRSTGATGLMKMYSFYPTKVDGLTENSEHRVQISCNGSQKHYDSVTLKLASADPDIAAVSSEKVILCQCDLAGSTSNMSQFVLRGIFLGRTVINVETLNATQLVKSVNQRPLKVINASLPVVDYHVSVVRKQRLIDHLFLAMATIMLICANVGMGCKIDMAVVKEVLRKPIAPAIGFGCQYFIMPLVSVLSRFFGVSAL